MIKWNSRLSFIFKLTVASLGLYFAYKSFDFTGVNIQISWETVSLLLLAFAVNVVAIFVSALRLYILSDSGVSYWELVRINFVGLFFNLFLPTFVGGDIARTVRYSKSSRSVMKSASIIFIDRMVGLSTLIMMGSMSLVLLHVYTGWEGPGFVTSVMVVLSAGTVVVWVGFYSGVISRIFSVFNKRVAHTLFRRYSEGVVRSMRGLRMISSQRLLSAAVVSVMYHLLGAFVSFLLSQALGLDIEFFVFLVFGTIASVILMIPISIGGLGVRDVVFNVLYGSVTNSKSISLLAPVSFLFMILVGAIGGVFFVLGDNKRGRLRS